MCLNMVLSATTTSTLSSSTTTWHSSWQVLPATSGTETEASRITSHIHSPLRAQAFRNGLQTTPHFVLKLTKMRPCRPSIRLVSDLSHMQRAIPQLCRATPIFPIAPSLLHITAVKALITLTRPFASLYTSLTFPHKLPRATTAMLEPTQLSTHMRILWNDNHLLEPFSIYSYYSLPVYTHQKVDIPLLCFFQRSTAPTRPPRTRSQPTNTN